MKKFEYLSVLKENLEGKLPPEAIKDILSDYESFFLSGREEGKTDDEISTELGSPEFLSKSLLETQEEVQTDKLIANPGRRLCAYLIDAVIAVLPFLIVTGILGSAIVSFLLLIQYPSPLVGALSSLAYNTYQVVTVTDTNTSTTISASEKENTVNSINKDIRRPTPVSITFAIFGIAFYMLYSLVATLIFRGQTIGKKLMHIKVSHSGKVPLTKGSIIIREFLGKILINSIPIIPLISMFTILFTKEHKALHDILADTIVVEV